MLLASPILNGLRSLASPPKLAYSNPLSMAPLPASSLGAGLLETYFDCSGLLNFAWLGRFACLSGAVLQLVKEDGGKDEGAEADFLFVGADLSHAEAVVDHGKNEDAEQGAHDAARTAGQTGAAHDNGCDGLEFNQLARTRNCRDEA